MATVTDTQIIELGVGQRADRFTFRLLNADRTPLGADLQVHEDQPPTLQVNTARTSFRTLSGMIVENPPLGLNIEKARVQPVVTLANGSTFALGVLMFGSLGQNVFTGRETWAPELFDETFLLDQGLPDSRSLLAGQSVLGLFDALAREVLDPLGVPVSYQIDDIGAANALPFKVGSSRNTALGSLAALLGAMPPFFDNRGVYTLKPAPQLGNPDHVYESGTRIFDATTTVTSSRYKAPNRYIVVGDDINGPPIRGVYDLPAQAPNSQAQTGRIVTAPTHTAPASSQALADQIAYVDALTDQTVYGTATFEAACDPRHDTFDTVQLLGEQYLESGWSLVCGPTGGQTHTLSRMWGS